MGDPRVIDLLVIGGLDPTGGAGLLRDAWTIAQLGPEFSLRAIASALTRQGRGQPAQAFPVAPAQLRAELDRVDEARVVKLGMIATNQLDVLAQALDRLRVRGAQVVLDPVLHASDGGAIGASPEALLALAGHVDLITPNRAERAALLERGPIPCAALCKTESVTHERVRDRLILTEGHEQTFERPCVLGPDPRGTGCALASAIACELARGSDLTLACARAIAWLDLARRRLVRGPDGRWQLAGSSAIASPNAAA